MKALPSFLLLSAIFYLHCLSYLSRTRVALAAETKNKGTGTRPPVEYVVIEEQIIEHRAKNTTHDIKKTLETIRNIPTTSPYYWLNEREREAFHLVSMLASIGFCRDFGDHGFGCGKKCDYFPNMKFFGHFLTHVHDVNGYVAYDEQAETIIVGWGGSSTIVNFLDDVKISMVFHGRVGSGVLVHRGFQLAYNEAREGVITLLSLLVQRYPKYTVLVTGHSLGAALAILHVVDIYSYFPQLRVKPNQIRLHTFGQPRVGNQLFADYVKQLPIVAKFVVQERDPIPHRPPAALGWRQAGTEIWVANERGDMLQCLPSDSRYCSKSIYPYFKWKNHLFYMGQRLGSPGCKGIPGK
ncbi:uncharacterized protein VTP21DRAFT_5039 [Calcarisporiella thermophila]|uniref:uncharacterized protein n=1 Tax=Calcarisporiella thermophila TaxID=911321 RepID=UPI00374330D9